MLSNETFSSCSTITRIHTNSIDTSRIDATFVISNTARLVFNFNRFATSIGCWIPTCKKSLISCKDSNYSKTTLHYCLVLLCDQNSFGPSKMVLAWPNWFGLDLNDLVTTKMKWSGPKWIGQIQIVIFYQNESHLDLTNSFWSWPFHFGRDQIIMVKSKSIWSDQNHFGPTKTVLVT